MRRSAAPPRAGARTGTARLREAVRVATSSQPRRGRYELLLRAVSEAAVRVRLRAVALRDVRVRRAVAARRGAATGCGLLGDTSTRLSTSTSKTGGITSDIILRSSKKAWRTFEAWIATSSICAL